MTRFCTALALVAAVGGCGAQLDQRFTKTDAQDGRVTDYVWMNPLCLFLCNTSLNAAASSAVGEGNTQSPSQNTNQGINGN